MPLATKRVSASVPPPAGNGTTILTGRVGIVLRGGADAAERQTGDQRSGNDSDAAEHVPLPVMPGLVPAIRAWMAYGRS